MGHLDLANAVRTDGLHSTFGAVPPLGRRYRRFADAKQHCRSEAEQARDRMNPVDAPTDPSENFRRVSRNSFGYFERYISGTAAEQLEIGLTCSMDDGNEIDAFVQAYNHRRFGMFLSRGLVEALITIHVATLRMETSTKSGPFADLAERMSGRPNLRISGGSFGPQDPVADVLHLSLFLTLSFVAYHELAHVRLGHFNRLFAREKREPGHSRRMMISECSKATMLNVATEGGRRSLLPGFKQMELEADILGFVNLTGTAVGLFTKTMPSGDVDVFSAAGAKGEAMLVSELALYSTCMCLSLLEVSRRRLGGSSAYPRPFTRILAVFRQFIVSTKGDWRIEAPDEGGGIAAVLEPDEIGRYADILATALGICHFTCEVSGLNLPKRYKIDSEADFLSDAFSMAHLVSDEGVGLKTPEARELAFLDGTVAKFKRRMKGFRLDRSDDLDGFV